MNVRIAQIFLAITIFTSENFGLLVPNVILDESHRFAACGRSVDRLGNIVSHAPTSAFPLNNNCSVTLDSGEDNRGIVLVFSKFNIGSNCGENYLLIYERTNISNHQLIRKLCGDVIPPVITSSGRYAELKFVTGNKSHNDSGFAAFYTSYMTKEIGCSENDFYCTSSGLCVNQHVVCDGLFKCEDGINRTKCLMHKLTSLGQSALVWIGISLIVFLAICGTLLSYYCDKKCGLS